MRSKLKITSGPSGSGKTTLMRAVLGDKNEIVSTTSRSIRINANECEGVDYYFVDNSRFEEMILNDELIEYAQYDGFYYGISKKEFFSKLASGTSFLVATYDALNRFEKIQIEYDFEIISIFIYSDYENVKKQLEHRGETEEKVKKRLEQYENDMNKKRFYQHVVYNHYGNPEIAKNKIREIISN
jgi:guanylate kinase